MDVRLPDESTRWRCAGCGNLTRFDVTRTRRTSEYWHFDLAGDHVVEETHTLAEEPEGGAEMRCRWCGRGDAIELVTRAEAAGRPAPDTATGEPSRP